MSRFTTGHEASGATINGTTVPIKIEKEKVVLSYCKYAIRQEIRTETKIENRVINIIILSRPIF